MRWKPIKDYEDRYMVSEKGDIISLKRDCGMGSRKEERPRKQTVTRGYATCGLSKNKIIKHHLVHRLVAVAFIPNPKKLPQINHKDGDKTNNEVSNLEWCDRSHNQVHARKNGLQGGERTNTAKLNKRCVKAIRYIYPKLTTRELAKAFGIGQSTISKIIRKEYWKYV
jgi:NUMOD4 motif/HNH endonuclease